MRQELGTLHQRLLSSRANVHYTTDDALGQTTLAFDKVLSPVYNNKGASCVRIKEPRTVPRAHGDSNHRYLSIWPQRLSDVKHRLENRYLTKITLTEIVVSAGSIPRNSVRLRFALTVTEFCLCKDVILKKTGSSKER